MQKQAIVQRGGWSFVVPPDDSAEIVGDGKQLRLRHRDGGEWDYPLLGVIEQGDEVVYEIDASTTNGEGYPFPSVAEEIDRLRQRWEAAGGDLTRFSAWAEGAGYESHLRRLRKELRTLEAPSAAAG